MYRLVGVDFELRKNQGKAFQAEEGLEVGKHLFVGLKVS